MRCTLPWPQAAMQGSADSIGSHCAYQVVSRHSRDFQLLHCNDCISLGESVGVLIQCNFGRRYLESSLDTCDLQSSNCWSKLAIQQEFPFKDAKNRKAVEPIEGK